MKTTYDQIHSGSRLIPTFSLFGVFAKGQRFPDYLTRKGQHVMAKTTRRTSTNKRAAKLPAALKAMENMVIEKADLGVSIKQITQKLAPAGISADVGYIAYAGLSSTGSGQVQINISSGGYASTWPEWAYEVAEGALHFNKKILVIYNNQPFGSNLLEALCLNETA